MLPIFSTLQPGELKMVPNSILVNARLPDDRKVYEWLCDQTTGIDKAWPQGGGNIGQRALMLAENGAVIATFPNGEVWMLFYGGGHEDGAYSGVVGYCISGPLEGKWRTLISHPEFYQGVPNYGTGNATYSTNPDGSPASRHTWGGLTWLPAPYYELLVTMGSQWKSGNADPQRRVWFGNPVTGTWRQHANPWFYTAKHIMFGCQFETPNRVVWNFEHQVRQRDLDTGTDVQLNKPATPPYYESFHNTCISVMDPINRMLYILEALPGPGMREFDLKTPGKLCKRLLPTGDITPLQYQRPGAAWRNGKLWMWIGGNNLYEASPPQWNFVKHTMTGDAAPSINLNGKYGCFGKAPAFVSDEHFIIATEVEKPLYVGRIPNGAPPVDTQAPAAPTLTIMPATWS